MRGRDSDGWRGDFGVGGCGGLIAVEQRAVSGIRESKSCYEDSRTWRGRNGCLGPPSDFSPRFSAQAAVFHLRVLLRLAVARVGKIEGDDTDPKYVHDSTSAKLKTQSQDTRGTSDK